jgi:lipopolysaccharide transport system ATP-binding protein
VSSSAISVEEVSKRFRLPLDRPTTLKYRVTHPRSSARYSDFYALRDISFEVPEGQFLGIIGANGCGKSTLLKLLARIYEPNDGRVFVNGMVSPFLELGVGFNPELTARENVFLNGAILGLTRRELQQRIDEIIAFAELEQFAEQKLKNFSSGMQVRLAFSVAIQADAGILLMDEVLAVGDARFQEKCFDVFSRYKRDGRTIVLVTHDLHSVNLYCDRALLLDHGRLLADGAATEVTAQYRRMVGAQSEAADAKAEAEAVGEGEPPTPGAARWGSRQVEITEVRLRDTNGVVHTTFATDAPMTAEFDFTVNDDSIGEFVAGWTFERSDGLELAGTHTALFGFTIPCPPRGTTGTVRYRIESLPLLTAAYQLSAAVYDRHCAHAFDHRQRVLSFRVVDERGRHGLVELGGHWSFEVAEHTAVDSDAAVAER